MELFPEVTLFSETARKTSITNLDVNSNSVPNQKDKRGKVNLPTVEHMKILKRGVDPLLLEMGCFKNRRKIIFSNMNLHKSIHVNKYLQKKIKSLERYAGLVELAEENDLGK